MAQTIEVEVFVVVDSAGDYATGVDVDKAKEAYENDVQALVDAEGFRVVKVVVKVPLPEVVELVGVVPETGAPSVLAVK